MGSHASFRCVIHWGGGYVRDANGIFIERRGINEESVLGFGTPPAETMTMLSLRVVDVGDSSICEWCCCDLGGSWSIMKKELNAVGLMCYSPSTSTSSVIEVRTFCETWKKKKSLVMTKRCR